METKPELKSAPLSFNKTDLKKIGKGALLAAIGAGVTLLLEGLSQIDYGPYTPLVTAAITVGINALRKFVM